ncbi:TadE family protein [Ruegeria profundi]|uniref:TadE/TadG family type IV pilus assembly protein n=1 Tax=Ruegeria profundi TaxID=1685378 RepID=UPI00147DE5F0
MIRHLKKKLRRFRREEKGMATIEFVMWFPIFIMTTYSGVEMGIVAWNHANLERALDSTIQDVRMNRIDLYEGETAWTHDLIKQIICDEAGGIPDCMNSLAVEMTRVNQFDSSTVLTGDFDRPFCVDTPEEIRGKDDQIFSPGTANELMIIRACVEISPLFFGTTLGQLARQDPDGQYELHATTVFVHEP